MHDDHKHEPGNPGDPTHNHSHTDTDGGVSGDSTAELTQFEKARIKMNYMLKHNREHAEDARILANELRGLGYQEAAEIFLDGIADYGRGNEKLEQALRLL